MDLTLTQNLLTLKPELSFAAIVLGGGGALKGVQRRRLAKDIQSSCGFLISGPSDVSKGKKVVVCLSK